MLYFVISRYILFYLSYNVNIIFNIGSVKNYGKKSTLSTFLL